MTELVDITDGFTGADLESTVRDLAYHKLSNEGLEMTRDLMDDVLSLSIGEPDFAAPDSVIQASIDSLKRKETSYTGNAGLMELRQTISDYFDAHYGVRYDPKTEIMLAAQLFHFCVFTDFQVLPASEIEDDDIRLQAGVQLCLQLFLLRVLFGQVDDIRQEGFKFIEIIEQIASVVYVDDDVFEI